MTVQGNDFRRLSEQYSYPQILTKNSTAQLLDSVAAILEKFPDRAKSNKNMPQFMITKRFGAVSLDGVNAVKSVIMNAAQNIGFNDEESSLFGKMIHKEILQDLGEDWKLHFQFLFPQKIGLEIFYPSLVLNACRNVILKTSISRNFDIPYLAGYSVKGPQKVYIDHDLPEPMILKNGHSVSTTIFLTIHETFEKSLMDLMQFHVKNYIRTHQLAQRLEKECVQAFGINWEVYDSSYDPEIERAENVKRKLKKVPQDLDLAPYIEYKDWQIIRNMKKVMTP